MTHASSFFTISITSLVVLLFIIGPAAASQLLGCDAEGIKCSRNNNNAIGVCSDAKRKNGIGIVSFDTNITTEGPLTWTLTQSERNNSIAFTERRFWLGIPPALNASGTNQGFGGCAMAMTNLTTSLQPPQDVNFADFSCGMVMGDDCVTDILSIIQQQLSNMVRNTTTASDTIDICSLLSDQLKNVSFPESCQAQIHKAPGHFLFDWGVDLFTTLGRNMMGFGFEVQDKCVASSGGPDYLVYQGPQTTTYMTDDDPELFRNGTTPVVTLFYNDPLNATGSAAFFAEPEAHLHCLTIAPSKGRSSASTQTAASSSTALFAILFSLFSLAWVEVAL